MKRDLTGQHFGKLTAVKYIPGKPGKWECSCECGNVTRVCTQYLINGVTKSCGCYKIKHSDKRQDNNPYYKKLYDAKTDLVGKRFGKLTVIKDTSKSIGRGKSWLCKCDCGNTTEILDARLRFNQAKSCGCSAYNKRDLIGQRFDHLTVLEKTNERYYGYVVWKCKCDCGNITYVPMHNLSYNKGVKSCGCMLNENLSSWGSKVHKHNTYRKNKKSYSISDENGNKFLIDLEDKDRIDNYYWTVRKSDTTVHAYNRKLYAKTKKRDSICLWRLILNDNNKKHKIVYKNGNKSDLRKENLIIVK